MRPMTSENRRKKDLPPQRHRQRMEGRQRRLARPQTDRPRPARRPTPLDRGPGAHQDRRQTEARSQDRPTPTPGHAAPRGHAHRRPLPRPMAPPDRQPGQTARTRHLPQRMQRHPQRHRRHETRPHHPRDHRSHVRRTRHDQIRQDRPQHLHPHQTDPQPRRTRQTHPHQPRARRHTATLRARRHHHPPTRPGP